MKKVFFVLLASVLLVFAVGCSANDKNDAFSGMTAQQIIDAIYEKADLLKEEFPQLQSTDITAENEEYYLGSAGIDYKEAVASEPMISAMAYSVCVVRMNEGADAAAAADLIRQSVNPAKWICVQVDPSNVIVDTAGDVIVLIMSNDFATPLHNAFVELKGN